MAEAVEDGGALLLTGEAGAGKTALLNVVAADARREGALVLRAAGAEFDAALSFAGLSELLQPILGQLSELKEIDQRALRVSLGLIDGTASEELAVAIGTLGLLTTVAAAQPVLVVVDDVNWLDRASAAVLAYIARRVGGTRIALIAAMRSGERTPFERGGLDSYELEPLSDVEDPDVGRCPRQRSPALERDLLEHPGIEAVWRIEALDLADAALASACRGGACTRLWWRT